MILFPNAKINIGLRVIRKRQDGYHDLETIYFPLAVTDILEFVPASGFRFQSTGLAIQGDPEQNLCIKAFRFLKERFPDLKEIAVHLHKVIPMGAGLGGGSADGSFLLKGMNDYFGLGLNQEDLIQLSLALGSDCPFFIRNETVYATGRGEIMEPISLSLNGYHIILVYPGIHVSTARAFSRISPLKPSLSLRDLVGLPITKWKDLVINDFEASVFEDHPAIGEIKSSLYRQGAVFASMSGSGSSCYGIFKEPVTVNFPSAFRILHVLVN